MSAPRYCIVGAGATGLASIEALRDAGIEFDCFEQDDRDRRPVAHRLRGAAPDHAARQLRLHRLPDARDLSAVPEPRPDARLPARLRRRARPRPATSRSRRASTRIAPDGRDWLVETSDGETRRYAGVIVANGHLRVPLQPELPGLHGAPAARRHLQEHRRHRGHAGARRRLGQLRLRHRGRLRAAAGPRDDDLDPQGPPVPAEDVRRQAAGRAVDHAAAAAAAGLRPADDDPDRGRSAAGVRAAGAGHLAPHRPEAGRQLAAAALDPPRPDRGRAGHPQRRRPRGRVRRRPPRGVRHDRLVHRLPRRCSRSSTTGCCSGRTACRCGRPAACCRSAGRRACTSSAWRRRAGRSCRSTRARRRWWRACCACRSGSSRRWRRRSRATAPPSARIDIVRSVWQRQMDLAEDVVTRMEAGERAS